MSQDFALLYRQLGLHPDCGLEDLKRAYRVRVAELHPDRHLDQSSEAHSALTELTALYSGAIRFHRIHGRLPGSTPRTTFTGNGAAPRAADTHAPAQPASRAVARPAQEPPLRTAKFATLGILVLVVVMVVLHWSETDVPTADVLHAGAVAEAAADAPRLELGMEEASVIAIQGQPERVQDDVWNYGSSWIRFEEGHVVDWASAPPNRLMTVTPRPVREEEDVQEP